MARKTQITREIILEAAFQMLLRDGYVSINITSLAREIGCSTQPIAWQFGSMDGLRGELLTYCLQFLKDRFVIEGTDVVQILETIAEEYIDIAFHYPNLYKYLYISDHDGRKMEDLARERRFANYEKIAKMLETEYSVSSEAAKRYLMDFQVYVHGIATFAITELPTSSKGELLKMVHRANTMFLKYMKENRDSEKTD